MILHTAERPAPEPPFEGSGDGVDNEGMHPRYGAAERSTMHVSPELVLIDPMLAEHARAWLPEAGDTLRRVERLLHESRIAEVRDDRVEALGAPAQLEAVQRESRGRAAPGRRSAVLAAVVTAGALVTALLVGVRVDLRGSPAGADTTTLGETPAITDTGTVQADSTTRSDAETTSGASAPKTKTASRSPRTKRSAPSRLKHTRAPRHFVWAPVGGASGYHVEFFRGSALVFSADTKSPEIAIPASWTLRGKRYTFEPGDYRWYVWPLRSGIRASAAVVQAKLAVSRG